MIYAISAAMVMAASPILAQAPVTADWHIRTTTRSVATVVKDLKTAIRTKGGRVVTVVDHAANARGAGSALPDTVLVIFGNPKLGTPLIARNRAIAIEFPQKILVWRQKNTTSIGYIKPAVTAARYGFAADEPAVIAIDNALSSLVATAAADKTD
ncbi:MAG: hypothetical protein NVS3B5_13370 [Sphingomicrobium sp.]